MKYIFRFILINITLPFFFSCSAEDDEAAFLLLGGNVFIMEVSRISENPTVQFPSDQLSENEYIEISQGPEYEVRFSEDMQTISILNDSITGLIVEANEEYKKYGLDKGLFAGGRFVVWITDGLFEAEYTIYGSGVPIIRSERGYLKPVKKP